MRKLFVCVALVSMFLPGCTRCRQTFTVSGETRVDTGCGSTQPVILRVSWKIDPVENAPSSSK